MKQIILFDNNNKSIYTSYQKPQTFLHGIIVKSDNVGYYFDGPADGANGTKDAPDHYWWQDSPTHLYGLHYNIGPFGGKLVVIRCKR